MTDDPCVICSELRFAETHSWRLFFLYKDKKYIKCHLMVYLSLINHLLICNVHRQYGWLMKGGSNG